MALPWTFATLATGNHPASKLDDNFQAVAFNTVMPTTASGTNAITLTPLANVPAISAYQNNMTFSFFAAASSTGAVTLQVGALPALNVYQLDGSTAVGNGDITIGTFLTATYSSALNAGSGGFVVSGLSSVVNYTVANEANAGAYRAKSAAGVAKRILAVANTSIGTDTTRLRSAGGGISFESSASLIQGSMTEGGLFNLALPGAAQVPSAGTPRTLGVLGGSSGGRITTINSPTATFSRFENVTAGGDGSQGPTLLVLNDSSGSTQNVAFSAFTVQSGSADTCAIYGSAAKNGPGITAAFAGFFTALAQGAGNSAIAIETATGNETGADRPYNPVVGGTSIIAGFDLTYGSTTGKLGGPAIQIRGNPGQLARWDVGIGFMQGDHIKTADLQTNTLSTTCFLLQGTHSYGLDFVSGTFTTSPIRLGNNSPIIARNFANNADFNIIGLNVLDRIALGDATHNVLFGSGSALWLGTTSGVITVSAPAVAGTGTLTLPVATDTLVGRATTDALTNKTVNGLTISTTTGTFTLTAAKTLSVSNTLTLAGTDATTITFQGTDTYVGRATTDTFTNKTIDGAATGNVITHAGKSNLVAHVYRNTNQTPAAGAWVKVQLNTATINTNTWFDITTNFRFQPNVAGVFMIVGQSQLNVGTTSYGGIAVYKNGVTYNKYIITSTTVDAWQLSVPAIVSLNGTTDFIEMFGFSSGATPSFIGGDTSTDLSIYQLY